MNEHVAIVILNYNTFSDTVDCINSIIKQDYPKELTHIIIVDNKSTDDSAQKLMDKYAGSGIHFVQSKENLGFANGNNLGILYARNVLHYNYVYLVNSDIEFYDKNVLFETMHAVEDGIAVCAPEIINTKLEPSYLTRLTVNSLSEQRKDYIKRRIYTLIISHKVINNIYSKVKHKRTVFIPPVYDGVHKRTVETSNDIWLPGCAFLLTPYYFNNYKMLYPLTFLYYEESILTILCKCAGLRLRYFDTSRILHKDGSSTKKTDILNKEISLKKLEWFCHGSKCLLNVMKSSYKKIKKLIDKYPLSLELNCSFVGEL